MKKWPLPYFRVLMVCTLLTTVSSCEKLLFEDDLGSIDPLTNFDHLWNEVDAKYSYFGLKGIDWDEVRTVYRPLINSGMHDEELFEVLAAMLNELRDDHVNLSAPFNTSRYNIALRNPPNYLARTVEEHYIPNGSLTGGFFHDLLHGGEVGYIRYDSFTRTVARAHMDYMLLRFRNTKGIVLDLRENGGGALINVPAILEHFTNERRLVGFSKTRNGPGRNDFSEPAPFHINPSAGLRYLRPVVVLTDRGSYSATTFFALAAKSFPNVVLMGDTTGGGGGLPNGGQLPNGWRYRFSITQLLDPDFNNFAESGVPPHVTAAFDWNDLTRDEIIDAAVALIVQ